MNAQEQTFRPFQILLVEKEANHVNRFLELANKNDWEVITQEGSLEAIKWIKDTNAPDLMILDKNATPLNGFQTYDYIKSELKLNIPVLISSESDIITEDISNKIICHIPKPFSSKCINTIKSKLNINVATNNAKEAKNKYYSLTYLKNTSDGDEDFVLTSLNLFKTSVSDKMKEMKEAVFNKNFKLIREIAHHIKPSFEILGSKTGTEICHSLVYKIDENEIALLVKQLDNLYFKMDLQLRKDIPKYGEA